MSTLAKNQHYVWRKYLRAWATNEKIHCWRRGANKVFGPNLTGIASETFFYRVQRLALPDIEYIRAIIESEPEDLRPLFNQTVEAFQETFLLRDRLNSLQASNKADLEQRLEVLEKTIADNFQGLVEREADGLLDDLRKMDCEFFANEKDCMNFINFLTHQHFRTPKFRATAYRPDKLTPGVDLTRTWIIENHFRATHAGITTYVDRDAYGCFFLRNRSATPFITGDQPVIFLDREDGELPNFFYPLGPSLALRLGSRDGGRASSSVKTVTEISADEVENYNLLMVNHSFDQIYASDRDYLDALSRRARNTSAA
jgi:Protein of unknown function (DUF4238)